MVFRRVFGDQIKIHDLFCRESVGERRNVRADLDGVPQAGRLLVGGLNWIVLVRVPTLAERVESMKSAKYWLLAACIAIASSGFMLNAQEGLSPIERDLKNVPGVPSGALLTERGRELAFELKNLYRSKESMGPRHPSLSAVEKRIKSVKELLKAFAPAENPFDSRAKRQGCRLREDVERVRSQAIGGSTDEAS